MQIPRSLLLRTVTASILVLVFVVCFSADSSWLLTRVLAFIATYTLLIEWPRLLSVSTPFFWLVTPLYPLAPFLMLIYLSHTGYRALIALLFIVVASFDTGAYIGGSLFGKQLLAPTISPKKTVEGAVCGFVLALGVVVLGAYLLNSSASFLEILLFSAILSGLALAGDLFESWLKRRAHVKDSGTFLPGHGGFLDRFDSILWGTYFIFFIKNYLANTL